MLLSALTGKELFLGKTYKGECRGVGVSLKSGEVKYLFCASAPSKNADADFALPISAVASVDEHIRLSRVRPVFPKSCAKLFLHRPVYDGEGVFLGTLSDVEIKDFKAVSITTSLGEKRWAGLIAVCSDAILLRKELPYPIGQPVPAPVLSEFLGRTDGVVTKPLLRLAMQQGALIKLTLSLPPFNLL
jgi:hypothetical protein